MQKWDLWQLGYSLLQLNTCQILNFRPISLLTVSLLLSEKLICRMGRIWWLNCNRWTCSLRIFGSQLGIILWKRNRLSTHHKLWLSGTKEEVPSTYSKRGEENVSCCHRTNRSTTHFPVVSWLVAGSDVAGLQTTALKSADGKYYIVNGQKKWITNGIWADYCTAAVRTGGPGADGISALIIPLENHPGVTTRKQQNSGVNASGILFVVTRVDNREYIHWIRQRQSPRGKPSW